VLLVYTVTVLLSTEERLSRCCRLLSTEERLADMLCHHY
jgi:hypothetical protein